jgi:hypothetical protein
VTRPDTYPNDLQIHFVDSSSTIIETPRNI